MISVLGKPIKDDSFLGCVAYIYHRRLVSEGVVAASKGRQG
jgi:hypothetical protein